MLKITRMIAEIGDSIENAFSHLRGCAWMVRRNEAPNFNEVLPRLG